MQKIALVGAPTSGKTELAQQLQQALTDRKVVVVDDYISGIEDRSDNTLGHFGSYLGNLQAAIGRWEAERVMVRDHNPDVVVTCGSVVESCVYNAVHALVEHNAEDGQLTIRALQNDKRASVSMTMLSIMAYDTFDYEWAFYLPMSEEERKADGSKWNAIVDEHIREAAEALSVTLIELPTKRDERLAKVLQEVLTSESETAASE